MEATQASCKVFASRYEVSPRELIEVFHRWIQRGRTGELLIDVADYSHVSQGPGVMLVSHDAFYSVDREQDRAGLKWRGRRGEPAPALELLRGAVRAALRAAAMLEEDLPGRIAFDASELLVGFDDRLRAPNTPATFEALRPELESLAREIFGEPVSLTHHGEPRACFRARLKAPSFVGPAVLRDRLG